MALHRLRMLSLVRLLRQFRVGHLVHTLVSQATIHITITGVWNVLCASGAVFGDYLYQADVFIFKRIYFISMVHVP